MSWNEIPGKNKNHFRVFHHQGITLYCRSLRAFYFPFWRALEFVFVKLKFVALTTAEKAKQQSNCSPIAHSHSHSHFVSSPFFSPHRLKNSQSNWCKRSWRVTPNTFRFGFLCSIYSLFSNLRIVVAVFIYRRKGKIKKWEAVWWLVVSP